MKKEYDETTKEIMKTHALELETLTNDFEVKLRRATREKQEMEQNLAKEIQFLKNEMTELKIRHEKELLEQAKKAEEKLESRLKALKAKAKISGEKKRKKEEDKLKLDFDAKLEELTKQITEKDLVITALLKEKEEKVPQPVYALESMVIPSPRMKDQHMKTEVLVTEEEPTAAEEMLSPRLPPPPSARKPLSALPNNNNPGGGLVHKKDCAAMTEEDVIPKSLVYEMIQGLISYYEINVEILQNRAIQVVNDKTKEAQQFKQFGIQSNEIANYCSNILNKVDELMT